MITVSLFHAFLTAVITFDDLEEISFFILELFIIFLDIKVFLFSSL